MKQIVEHLAGSKAYGTNTPESDTDIRGIFVADPKHILTPFFPFNEKVGEGEDNKSYEVRNFMKLYCEGNPNILESLWVDMEDVLFHDEEYLTLRKYREALLSKKVAFTFSGYAISQLKRIKGHNKWINNPQELQPPQQIDYLQLVHNFTPEKLFAKDFNPRLHLQNVLLVPYSSGFYAAIPHKDNVAYTGNGEIIAVKDAIEELQRQTPLFLIQYKKEEYIQARDNHANYWNWKQNRNVARNALEEKFGFDTKHAMHLVRLLRMGEEILSGHGVIVKRPDAAELLAIRSGEWKYDDLVKWAEEKDAYVRGPLYEHSKLPHAPDINLAARVLMVVQGAAWKIPFLG